MVAVRFRISFFMFLFVFFSCGNLLSSTSIYPQDLTDCIREVNKKPNTSNVTDCYNIFLKYKGISDRTVAYAFAESFLEHNSSPDRTALSIMKKISPEDSEKIGAIFEKSRLKRLYNIFYFFDSHSVYKILKFSSVIFLVILFLYLFIKNHYIFVHSHSYNHLVFNYLKSGIFFFIVIFLGLYLKGYQELIFGCGIAILLTPENRFNGVFVSVILFLLVFFSAVVPYYSKNTDFYLHRISVNPVSKEYMTQNMTSKDAKILNLIKNIKYPSEDDNISGSFSGYNEAVNTGILYLIQGDYAKFEQLSKKYNFMDNPVVVMNLTSYFAKTYQYQNYESFLAVLYGSYPMLYQVFQDYQDLNKTQTFYPYFPEVRQFRFWFEINQLKLIISFIVLSLFLGISYRMSAFKPFQCGSCGENFCIKCNDGYLYQNVCENCRSLKKKISQANAAILLKKSIQIDRFAYKKGLTTVFLAIFLPGSNFITLGNLVAGIFVTLVFSVFLALMVLNWSFLSGPDNLGFRLLTDTPGYAYAIFSLVVYILNIVFGRKR